MRLLLDTHILLWWLADSPKLKKKSREIISDENNIILISAVTAWEIAIKKALGKLDAPENLNEVIERSQFEPLNISIVHATQAGKLPKHHEDPFDRMLIAQAIEEQLTVMSHDEQFTQYDVALIQS